MKVATVKNENFPLHIQIAEKVKKLIGFIMIKMFNMFTSLGQVDLLFVCLVIVAVHEIHVQVIGQNHPLRDADAEVDVDVLGCRRC